MNVTYHINVVLRKFAYSLTSRVVASPNSIVTAIVNSDAYHQSPLMDKWETPFGNCLPGTELLQSPFRMEFSMGSLLQNYCQYLLSLRRLENAGADAKLPINARLTKHCKIRNM